MHCTQPETHYVLNQPSRLPPPVTPHGACTAPHMYVASPLDTPVRNPSPAQFSVNKRLFTGYPPESPLVNRATPRHSVTPVPGLPFAPLYEQDRYCRTLAPTLVDRCRGWGCTRRARLCATPGEHGTGLTEEYCPAAPGALGTRERKVDLPEGFARHDRLYLCCNPGGVAQLPLLMCILFYLIPVCEC